MNNNNNNNNNNNKNKTKLRRSMLLQCDLIKEKKL